MICSLGSYGYDWTTTLPPEVPQGKKGSKTQKAPPPEKVLSSQYTVDPGGMAGSGGLRIRDRPRRRLPQRPLRLRRRRCSRPSSGLVPRRRHHPQPDARRAHPRHPDLCPLEARLGRQLDVEDLGPPDDVGPGQGTRAGRARIRRRYRRRRRHPPRHPQAAERQTHRHHGRRRFRACGLSHDHRRSRWTPTRSPTPSNNMATIRKRSRSASTTVPTRSGRRRSSTFSRSTTSKAPSS